MVKLSIIIPCYNAAETLPQALESIFTQSFRELEIIVVDGCSTDGTATVLKDCPAEKLRHIVEPDRGIYDAMNKGVALAEGEWILFLGADDRLYDKNVIEDMLGGKRAVDQYDAVIGDIQFDNGRVRKSRLSAGVRYRNTVHHQSAFYKRTLFQHFRYNDSYRVSADYELNLLLFLQGLNVLKRDRIVTVVGLGGASDKVDSCGYAEEIEIRNRYLGKSVSRGVMNGITRLRYVLKRAGKMLGWNFHFYN